MDDRQEVPGHRDGLRDPLIAGAVAQDLPDALRDHFRNFVRGSKSAENFSFDFIDGTRTIRSAIHMTRALEADAVDRSEIVILNIKQVEP